MDSMDWRDELHKLLATIKPQATATLLTIKEKFELQFNANFKQQCASIFNEWLSNTCNHLQEERRKNDTELMSIENKANRSTKLPLNEVVKIEEPLLNANEMQKSPNERYTKAKHTNLMDAAATNEISGTNVLDSPCTDIETMLTTTSIITTSTSSDQCDNGQAIAGKPSVQGPSSQIPDLLVDLDARLIAMSEPVSSSFKRKSSIEINSNFMTKMSRGNDNEAENPLEITTDITTENTTKITAETPVELSCMVDDSRIIENQNPNTNRMAFSCAHCPETDGPRGGLKSSVAEVHQHWLYTHSSDSKPFQFCLTIKICCFHCNFIGTFTDLCHHHREQHTAQSFAVVSLDARDKCGICDNVSIEMIEHFNNDHESILQIDVINPMVLNDEALERLLAIDTSQIDQFHCVHCDRVFNTAIEIEFHSAIEHPDSDETIMATKTPTKMVTKSTNQEPYLICVYCESIVSNRDQYLNHTEEHRYEFKCSKCEFNSNKLIELVLHDKQVHRTNSLNYRCMQLSEWLKTHFAQTKYVFENGLVLLQLNLTRTKFGDTKLLFDLFVDELMTIIKQKYKSEYEPNEWNDDGDGDGDGVDMEQPNGLIDNQTCVELQCSTEQNISSPNRLPIPDRALNMKELRAQNKLINNLCIYGIPYFKNENRNGIFMNLCTQLQANVNHRDIIKISRSPGKNALLIVELSNFEVKERVLRCAYMKQIWSSNLIQLPAGMPRQRIFVNIHTTKFYGRMAKLARNAMQLNLLHSFWITKYGFLVKRTENSKDKIVLSPDELDDFINRRSDALINRKKQFYRSIAWVQKT